MNLQPVSYAESRTRGGLVVQELGAGPRIVLVHGGGVGGGAPWAPLHPLAADFRLVMPFRRGYGPNPAVAREDFVADAQDLAPLLETGAHLVGHSYGGIVAALMAAAQPALVRSLTLLEPGLTSPARGNPVVSDFESRLAYLEAHPPADPEAHLSALVTPIEPTATLPTPLPPPLQVYARRLSTLRSTNEAIVDLETIRGAGIPSLVVTGAHSAVFEAIGDALTAALAATRIVVPGGGHFPHKDPGVWPQLAAFLAAHPAKRTSSSHIGDAAVRS